MQVKPEEVARFIGTLLWAHTDANQKRVTAVVQRLAAELLAEVNSSAEVEAGLPRDHLTSELHGLHAWAACMCPCHAENTLESDVQCPSTPQVCVHLP